LDQNKFYSSDKRSSSPNTRITSRSESLNDANSVLVAVISGSVLVTIIPFVYVFRRYSFRKRSLSTGYVDSAAENPRKSNQQRSEKSTSYGMIASNILGGATIMTSVETSNGQDGTLYVEKEG
jgi:hypothetical protein